MDFSEIKPDNELEVLVIDNQALVHEVVQQAFGELGVKSVVCTQNAYRALRECEQKKFDIVLLAFNVSEDKDGFHLFEELRLYKHITEATTVIFLSADTDPQLVNCIVEMQPDDFWVKPLDKQRVMSRLNHMFAMRHRFHRLSCCLIEHDYGSAIYQAERLLSLYKLKEFHPKLRRIKGDCLVRLFAYQDAERYYTKLMQEHEAGWIQVGLLRSMLKQDKLDSAQDRIEALLERKDTRFPVYDLLAQHYIAKADYVMAYEQMKRACELAPRNMDRNRKLWDLARLNHDRRGQLQAVQAMARYAKNSIHDSPMLTLNVMRASIDLASTVQGGEGDKLIRNARTILSNLRHETYNHADLKEALVVAEARIASYQNDKQWAEKLLKEENVHSEVVNVEDSLDKMKVFHELGMRERCMSVLEKLKLHIAGDAFSSEVVNAYIKQESIERREVSFTAKELKHMASTHYQNGRFEPAFDALVQAATLSPDDTSLAFSTMKVAAKLKANGWLSEGQEMHTKNANTTLQTVALNQHQSAKLKEFRKILKPHL